jgi:hypothetical protein
VGHRRAENGHDRIADELLDGPSPPLEFASEPGVVRREHRADVFRVQLLGSAREPDEVCEQHGDDLALLARPGGLVD